MQKTVKLTVAVIMTTFVLLSLLLCSCSSSGTGSDIGYNSEIPVIPTPTSSLTIPPPTPSPTPAPSNPVTSVSGLKGFIYYAPTKTIGGGLVYSPLPLDTLTPAAGATITLRMQPPAQVTTKSDGSFDFWFNADLLSSSISMIAQLGNLSTIFPVVPQKPAAELSYLRIMTANSRGRDVQLLPAGGTTTLILADLFGTAVQDKVDWSLSDPAMGIINGSVFTAGNTEIRGEITASVNGTKLTSQTVTITTNTGNLYGTVSDKSGKTTEGLVITVEGFGINFSGGAVVSQNGTYSITPIPMGYTYLLTITDKAGNIINYTKETSSSELPNNLIVDLSQTAAAQSLTMKTTTDKMSYKPGDTVQTFIEITNLSSYPASLEDKTITYTLIETDFLNGIVTSLDSKTGSTGRMSIPGNSTVKSETGALLTLPSTANGMMRFYTIAANVDGVNFATSFNSSIAVSTEEQSLGTGSGSGSGSGLTDDASIRACLKGYLTDCYWIINDAANDADHGSDVTEKVNSGSILVFKLNIARNDVLYNYSDSYKKSSWQHQIDDIKASLSKYTTYKDGAYLNKARSQISSLRNSVDAQ